VRKRGFPSLGENVVVTVTSISPYSALCRLEEYPGKEGMIHISEVASKWVRDIRKFVKLNKTYVAKVIRVDERSGFIGLSLKRVARIEKTKKLQEYKQEQRAEKMLELVAKKAKIGLDEAYEKIGFELQDRFGGMYKAFLLAYESPEPLIRKGIEEKWARLIHEIAKDSIQKRKVKIKAELNLTFYAGNGIERIKEFLLNLKNKYKLDVKYISAPRYIIEIETEDPKNTQKQLEKILTNEVSKVKDGEASFKIGG